MTPQEKALIDSVFDRLAQTTSTPKDPDALAYIRDRAAKLPDAAYGLTQAVLIQEMALNHATTRIAQLEHALSQQEGAPVQGSSFLGGAAGASSAGPWGTRPTQSQAQPQPQPQQAPYQAAQPQYQQPQYQQPAYQQPAAGPWGGGGFLRNAASMAAGVAGGTLLAEGIASLFGGHHLYGGYGGFGGAGYGPWGGQSGMVENVENITVNNYGDADTAAGRDSLPQMDDPNLRDASFDDAGDDSSSFDDGGFDGGSDFSDV